MSKGRFAAKVGEHLKSSNWKYNPNSGAFKNTEYYCDFLAKQSNIITSINMLNGSGEDWPPQEYRCFTRTLFQPPVHRPFNVTKHPLLVLRTNTNMPITSQIYYPRFSYAFRGGKNYFTHTRSVGGKER